jgi:hypothetical protein
MKKTITLSIAIALMLVMATIAFVNATPRLLKECNMVYWTSDDATLRGVAGNQVSGFKLKLDGNSDPDFWYYLNIKFIKPDLPEGVYMFWLTPPADSETAFWNYWAAKGVTASAAWGTNPSWPSWQWIMWRIIHGASGPFGTIPMFGLYSDGNCNYELRDGLVHFASHFAAESPLRLNGDYPKGTYTFTCLGATGTVNPYPPLLENILDGVQMNITLR